MYFPMPKGNDSCLHASLHGGPAGVKSCERGMASSQSALLILAAALAAAAEELELSCEPWCKEPCAILNGNVQDECSGCADNFACRPGAPGFDKWEERHKMYVDALGEAAPESSLGQEDLDLLLASPQEPDEPSSQDERLQQLTESSRERAASETVRCQHIDAAALDGLSAADLAQVFKRPTIIRGLIDSWPAHERFARNMSAFIEAFGETSGILMRRLNFVRSVPAYEGKDRSTTIVPLAEFMQNMRTVSRRTHNMCNRAAAPQSFSCWAERTNLVALARAGTRCSLQRRARVDVLRAPPPQRVRARTADGCVFFFSRAPLCNPGRPAHEASATGSARV